MAGTRDSRESGQALPGDPARGGRPSAGSERRNASGRRENNVDFGRRGEDVVAAHLSAQGWQILDRNWRAKAGEIDIVAIDTAGPRPVLAVIEVKTRSGTGFGWGSQAITAGKYARLRRLAASWVAAHRAPRLDIRIDIVSVLLRQGSAPQIDHVRGAYR